MTTVHRWFPVLPGNLTVDKPATKPVPQRGWCNRSVAGAKQAAVHGGLTDQQVLDLRGMYQFQGVGYMRLAEFFERDIQYVRSLCNYRTRCHLDPSRHHYPVGGFGRAM